MEKKYLLSLEGHEHDRVELQRMVEEAGNDIKKFTEIYRAKFKMAADLISEKEAMHSPDYGNKKYLPVNNPTAITPPRQPQDFGLKHSHLIKKGDRK